MDHEINPLILWSGGEKTVQDVVSLVTIRFYWEKNKIHCTLGQLHMDLLGSHVCNVMISSFPQESKTLFTYVINVGHARPYVIYVNEKHLLSVLCSRRH